MKRLWLLITIGALLGVAGLVFWRSDLAVPRQVAGQQLPHLVPVSDSLPQWSGPHGAGLQMQPVETAQVHAAAQTMALARQQGDPRSPPIKRRADTSEPPKQADLANGDAFNAYEQRMSTKTYQNFIQAADTEIPKIQAQIQQGQSMGISPDRLAVGVEKLQRMQNMRAQLLAQHPELQP